MTSSQAEPGAPVTQAPTQVEPPVAPAPAAETAETPAAPRRAGWWSRRFGGGE
jgi:ribonuclease E